MRQEYDVLVVGAGHAGAQVAASLRQFGFAGSIGLMGEEPELPYERPPLSKDYLAGEKPFERLLIRPPKFWEERKVDILVGLRCVAVEPTTRHVRLPDGRRIGYGKLVWAAGGTPRRLTCAGSDLRGVHHIRTRADIDALALELPQVRSVVVVGGGYIGLEVAAVLNKLGKKVAVLEAMGRVLSRVAGEPLSRFYEGEHRAHGVDVRLGASVECVEDAAGSVTGVRLTDGGLVRADMVVVGIGIVPSVEPLIAAGAEARNGVAVNRFCETSLQDVFAIGDCALHANDFADGMELRLESVQNANDMATTVARVITGDRQPYASVPWFWSNQYDLRLQTVGLSAGHDAVVIRGDPKTRSFSVVYLKAGQVIALDAVNMTKDFVQGRQLVTHRARPSLAALGDADVPLKSLLS